MLLAKGLIAKATNSAGPRLAAAALSAGPKGFAPMANFGGGGLGGANFKNFGGALAFVPMANFGGIAFVPMAISGDFGGTNFGNFGLSSGFGNFGTKSDDGLNAGLAFGERGRGLAFAIGDGPFGGEVGSGDVG